jgi:hypothetical protein
MKQITESQCQYTYFYQKCLKTEHLKICKDENSEYDTRGKIYRKKSQQNCTKDEIKTFNVGIKSLRATMPAEIFYWRF